MAAHVSVEPTYHFYLNGLLLSEWKKYGSTGSHPDNEAELLSRLDELVLADGQDLEEEEVYGAQITQAQLDIFRGDFKAVDVNDSGEVDIHEVESLLKLQLGRQPDQHQIDSVMSAFDTDGNGTIEFNEYMDWMLGEEWCVAEAGAHGEDEPKSWQFSVGKAKIGRSILTVFADRMLVYQRNHPVVKGEDTLADRWIGRITEDSRVAIVPKWTHAAMGIDSKLDMRASWKEAGANEIDFQMESVEDLVRMAKPQSISMLDFTSGTRVKLKGTKKAFKTVASKMLTGRI
eukprot:TRINITY_DN18280_c0_g1_i4.p1 TRINITY_DN18280_c0_g1~~TRINITY_DN18280_c0_g1_i4.p1  ORF type:complete len:288 (+),score=66.55 TRINITY_DN18280_c0_g1_i4:208-1071(+)